MKKIKVYNLFIFLLGLTCLSLGIVLVIKSDLGVSVGTSPPYILSLYFTKVSFGQWNYIVHGLVLILLVIIVRRLTIKHLMSFFVAFLFGLFIDFFDLILISLESNTMVERIILFIIGSIIISIGVAGLMKSNYPILPFDTFVKEITMTKNIKYSKFKTGFDLTCFTSSVILSLIFFGRVKGLGLGTLISALVLGSTIGLSLDIMDKYIEGRSIFPEEKTRLIMDFDILNRKTAKS